MRKREYEKNRRGKFKGYSWVQWNYRSDKLVSIFKATLIIFHSQNTAPILIKGKSEYWKNCKNNSCIYFWKYGGASDDFDELQSIRNFGIRCQRNENAKTHNSELGIWILFEHLGLRISVLHLKISRMAIILPNYLQGMCAYTQMHTDVYI